MGPRVWGATAYGAGWAAAFELVAQHLGARGVNGVGGQPSTKLFAHLLFAAELLSKLRRAACKVSKNNRFFQLAIVAAGAQIAEQTCP